MINLKPDSDGRPLVEVNHCHGPGSGHPCEGGESKSQAQKDHEALPPGQRPAYSPDEIAKNKVAANKLDGMRFKVGDRVKIADDANISPKHRGKTGTVEKPNGTTVWMTLDGDGRRVKAPAEILVPHDQPAPEGTARNPMKQAPARKPFDAKGFLNTALQTRQSEIDREEADMGRRMRKGMEQEERAYRKSYPATPLTSAERDKKADSGGFTGHVYGSELTPAQRRKADRDEHNARNKWRR